MSNGERVFVFDGATPNGEAYVTSDRRKGKPVLIRERSASHRDALMARGSELADACQSYDDTRNVVATIIGYPAVSAAALVAVVLCELELIPDAADGLRRRACVLTALLDAAVQS